MITRPDIAYPMDGAGRILPVMSSSDSAIPDPAKLYQRSIGALVEIPRYESPMVGWVGQLSFEVLRGDKRLTIVAQPRFCTPLNKIMWSGLAVEAPADAEALADILRNHSHSDICTVETAAECMTACEAYVQEWAKAKDAAPPCPCDDIQPWVASQAEVTRMRTALENLREWALNRAPGNSSTFSPATATSIAYICEEALGLDVAAEPAPQSRGVHL